ncbi:hypothetical protein SDC9_162582 [bioreactor metagenome]|uniref:Uncharacterized protein n=1 Tax=bioreactor metagenome TaxID=1076179 RepID=A0A645FNU3_9ZZZZ
MLAEVLAHKYHGRGTAAIEIIRKLAAIEIKELRESVHRHADAVFGLPPIHRDRDPITRLYHAETTARIGAAQVSALGCQIALITV